VALPQCPVCGHSILTGVTRCSRCGNSPLPANQSTSQDLAPSEIGTFFRKPAAPTPPSPAPTRKTKAARDAVIRGRLLRGAAMLTSVFVLLALASLVSMWVLLAPLGIICLGAMGVGLLRAVQNRGLPYLPKTRRVHSVFLILIAPAIFILAFDLGPKTSEQRQYWDAVKRRLNDLQLEKQAEEARRETAVTSVAPSSPAPRLIVTIENIWFEHGYMNIFGKVENVGNAEAFSPTLKLDVYDETGNTLLASDSAWPAGHMLKAMAPGRAAVFEMMTRLPVHPRGIRYTLRIDRYPFEVRRNDQ